MEHVRDDGRVEGGAADLNPENRSTVTTWASGACSASRRTAAARSRPWVPATTSEVSNTPARSRNCRRRVVSRPVVITVLSIPTRVARTGATSSTAATTARITVFQPTPNAKRIRSIGTLSADIATAARAAALDHTAPGATDGVRSAKVRSPRCSPAAACATAAAWHVPRPAGAGPSASASRRHGAARTAHGGCRLGHRGQLHIGDQLVALADVSAGQGELGQGEHQLAPPLDTGRFVHAYGLARSVGWHLEHRGRTCPHQASATGVHPLPRGRPKIMRCLQRYRPWDVRLPIAAWSRVPAWGRSETRTSVRGLPGTTSGMHNRTCTHR